MERIKELSPVTVRTENFEWHRSLLFSIAYRMLGSVTDAEDIVQGAYLRCQEAPEVEVHSPKGYLSAVVTRLSIDRLRSARVQREEYVGPWLPEPLLADLDEEVFAFLPSCCCFPFRFGEAPPPSIALLASENGTASPTAE